MKTKEEITVIISPRSSWGQESSSYAFAVRDGAFRAVESYEVGDLLIAGTNRKSMLGRVIAIEARPDGNQAVKIISLAGSRGRVVAGHNIYEFDMVPPHFIAGHEEGETLNGAYRSIVDGGDVAVVLPEDAYVLSTEYGERTWADYQSARRRAEIWNRVQSVREAISCLRNLLIEERENPAIFERVFRDDGSGKADWFMSAAGERHFVIAHDDDCPLLSAIEHQLYEAEASDTD
jgi:FKBP-type peptidyl-prolyl cis-trans isomerases 2